MQGTEGRFLAGADTSVERPQPGTINSGPMYKFWHRSLGDFDALGSCIHRPQREVYARMHKAT